MGVLAVLQVPTVCLQAAGLLWDALLATLREQTASNPCCALVATIGRSIAQLDETQMQLFRRADSQWMPQRVALLFAQFTLVAIFSTCSQHQSQQNSCLESAQAELTLAVTGIVMRVRQVHGMLWSFGESSSANKHRFNGGVC